MNVFYRYEFASSTLWPHYRGYGLCIVFVGESSMAIQPWFDAPWRLGEKAPNRSGYVRNWRLVI